MVEDKHARTTLKVIGGAERHRFSGTFEEYGFKISMERYTDPTLLLVNLKDEQGQILADHLWLNCTKQFQNLGDLSKGDTVAFNGRITSYTKGYKGKDPYRRKKQPLLTDYKIERPTKVELLATVDGRDVINLPEANWDLVKMIAKRRGIVDRLPSLY